MIPRFLNGQGMAGLAAAFGLAVLLLLQRLEAQHWHEESDRFEKLYKDEQLAFAQTTASYREAADAARASDRANAARVAAEQQTINERTQDDYQKRIADARAAAERLRQELAAAPADPRGGKAAAMPGLPTAAGSTSQAADDHRLPAAGADGDAALIATEQAIQLDELIKWVKRQSAIDLNGAAENASYSSPVHP
jgi:hypothetical protein